MSPSVSPAVTTLPRRAALQSVAALAVGATGLAGAASCTAPPESSGRDPATPPRSSAAASPPRGLVVAADGRAGVVDAGAPAHEQTVAASRALLDRADAVVVGGTDADVPAASDVARRLGLPLLVAGSALGGELERLGVGTVVLVGNADAAALAQGHRTVVDGSDAGAVAALPRQAPPSQGSGASVLLAPGSALPPAVASTVASVGAHSIELSHADPRQSSTAVQRLRSTAGPTLGIGGDLGPAERLTQRVRTARHAEELPGGGLLPFPGRRMVALYGHPGTASLGMLGEQSATEAVSRAATLAKEYGELTRTPVVPAFEIISTVASRSRGRDGSYSIRAPMERLLPWVEAAEEAGVYVVLDLQPGRTDFLEQAQHYEELLRRPWVGLALDPEWRLREDQVHLEQIGSVSVDEVNRVGAWLAALVREHDLPPKVLTLHQFRTSMVRGRERLDTSLDEVQWLVHADGLGRQGAKQETWSSLKRDLPEGVWLGWKNFEDEDDPMLTPEQTVEQVSPTPWFISYQ